MTRGQAPRSLCFQHASNCHSMPLSQQTQGCVGYLCLEIHTSLFCFPPAESPWALPVVADHPASLAKVVMAELANLKPENKPWPGGKALPACWSDRMAEARCPCLQEGMSAVWESVDWLKEWGLCQVGGQRPEPPKGA